MKYSKFGIHVKVANFDKSFKFYNDLGFTPVFAYGDSEFIKQFKNIPTAKDNYRGVTYEINNSMFEIGEAHIAVKPEVFKEPITSSKVSAMIDINSVEELLALCKSKNIPIAVPPRIFPWGTREVVIKDPDGFVLVFREFVK